MLSTPIRKLKMTVDCDVDLISIQKNIMVLLPEFESDSFSQKRGITTILKNNQMLKENESGFEFLTLEHYIWWKSYTFKNLTMMNDIYDISNQWKDLIEMGSEVLRKRIQIGYRNIVIAMKLTFDETSLDFQVIPVGKSEEYNHMFLYLYNILCGLEHIVDKIELLEEHPSLQLDLNLLPFCLNLNILCSINVNLFFHNLNVQVFSIVKERIIQKSVFEPKNCVIFTSWLNIILISLRDIMEGDFPIAKLNEAGKMSNIWRRFSVQILGSIDAMPGQEDYLTHYMRTDHITKEIRDTIHIKEADAKSHRYCDSLSKMGYYFTSNDYEKGLDEALLQIDKIREYEENVQDNYALTEVNLKQEFKSIIGKNAFINRTPYLATIKKSINTIVNAKLI